jgi:hypothetical protein
MMLHDLPLRRYEDCRRIEAIGIKMAERFLERHGAQFVLVHGGQTAKFLQQIAGDIIAKLPRNTNRYWAIEVKTERSKRWGNIFLEWFSNRNLEDRASHGYRGSKMGWFAELRSDLLWYQFIDEQEIHVFDLFALQRWALWTSPTDKNDRSPALFGYPLKPEGLTDQKNDTWGFCVKLEHIATVPAKDGTMVPYKIFRPDQYELFERSIL